MLSDCPVDVGKGSELALLEQSSRHWWTRDSSSSTREVAAPVNRLCPGDCGLESCQICRRIAFDKRQCSCFYDRVINSSTMLAIFGNHAF